jgi:hypothetical protein
MEVPAGLLPPLAGEGRDGGASEKKWRPEGRHLCFDHCMAIWSSLPLPQAGEGESVPCGSRSDHQQNDIALRLEQRHQ